MDTHLLGPNFLILERTGMVCSVKTFQDSLPTISMEIVSGITAYDSPLGEVVLLTVHQALEGGRLNKLCCYARTRCGIMA